MIVISNEFTAHELYDQDEESGDISKVLRCFHGDDSVTFDRFPYWDDGNYREATEKELKKWQCTYYLEDGNRPFKTKDCTKCDPKGECNHNQKYY